MTRKSKKVPVRKLIALYCEGESEKEYFEMLKRKYRSVNVTIKIKPLQSTGKKLLENINAQVKYLRGDKRPDEVFAVFDRDRLTNNEVAECKKFADKSGINLLFSSISFEIWILLHYEKVSAPHSNKDLLKKLSGKEYFNQSYAEFKGSDYTKYLFDRVREAKINGEELLIK